MINTLYLPELREMLAANDTAGMREFCEALHPARTAEFMEGLDTEESWRVLQHADPATREEVFHYLESEKKVEILETQDRSEIAGLVAELAPDDRVDLLQDADQEIVDALLPMLPDEERRDILRLLNIPEGVAGAVMTTEVACFSETLSAKEALEELGRQAENLETIYYLYVVDDNNQLRGVVSARQLVSAMLKPDVTLTQLMETDLVAAHVFEDQELVAQKVARYDLLAIPVVDDERRMLGIITHDDVIDVMQEEATEDAHRTGGVAPLEESYLKTPFFILGWKRGIWLTILFFAALLTAFALEHYETTLKTHAWLVLFIPLVISSGGNSGSQSAALIITGLARRDLSVKDWRKVLLRELGMGFFLGGFLAMCGLFASIWLTPGWQAALVAPLTLVLVVACGALLGAMLPLLFNRLGLDPALMSNPFVAGIIDILGIVIYVNVAMALMSGVPAEPQQEPTDGSPKATLREQIGVRDRFVGFARRSGSRRESAGHRRSFAGSLPTRPHPRRDQSSPSHDVAGNDEGTRQSRAGGCLLRRHWLQRFDQRRVEDVAAWVPREGVDRRAGLVETRRTPRA